MLKIVLRRFGKRKLPFFQIIVCVRTKKNRWLYRDRIGFIKKAGSVRFMGLDVQKFSYWLLKGANYCTSLVKYFALYTRMHKFEWRTYSKNFKKTEAQLMREDLLNNLLWKWLSYKTKTKFKSKFTHLKFFDFEQDFDSSIADFSTYITWKYKRMRRMSNLFIEDVNRYKLRLNNRKYYLLYAHAFSKYLRKQKRYLFRYNILQNSNTIDLLKHNIFVGKLRRRFKNFSYNKFLKTYKRRPSYTEQDLWAYDPIKPVERYITLLSTFIHKYNPLKDHIFSLDFRLQFFSMANMELLYVWQKNLKIFRKYLKNVKINFNNDKIDYLNNLLSQLDAVTNRKSNVFNRFISNVDIILNNKEKLNYILKSLFILNKKRRSTIEFLRDEITLFSLKNDSFYKKSTSLFFNSNLDNVFVKKKKNYDYFRRNVKLLFSENKSMLSQKFKIFIKAFKEDIGGPFYFKKTAIYSELNMKYLYIRKKYLDSKKHILCDFSRNDFLQSKNLNLSKIFRLQKTTLMYMNINSRRNFFDNLTFKPVLNCKLYNNKIIETKELSNLLKKINPVFIQNKSKSVFNLLLIKNIELKKQYIFYKKYNYNNSVLLNKYILLLKYASIYVTKSMHLNFLVKNFFIIYRNLFLNLIKNRFIIKWLLHLKSDKYLLLFNNIRSEYFINYYFTITDCYLYSNKNVKYIFWSLFLKKPTLRTKDDFKVLFYSQKSFQNKQKFIILMKLKINIYNKFLFILKTFLTIGEKRMNVTDKFILKPCLITDLVHYLKYKFSILSVLLNQKFIRNRSETNICFKTQIEKFISFLSNFDNFKSFEYTNSDNLYYMFLNLQKIISEIEIILFQTYNNNDKTNYTIFLNSEFLELSYKNKNIFNINSMIYLRNFYYFDNISINKNSTSNLFTNYLPLKNLFKNKFLHNMLLTQKLFLQIKKNKIFFGKIESFFNNLLNKFNFEYIWQKIYNLFLKKKENKFFSTFFKLAKKKVLLSKFKMFCDTHQGRLTNFFFKKKRGSYICINKIFNKFKNFIFYKENIYIYVKSIFKYFYYWNYIFIKFKKSFFNLAISYNIKFYLSLVLKIFIKWDPFKIDLSSTKFGSDYDLLLNQVKITSDVVEYNPINVLQKLLHSKYFAENNYLLEKTLDTYIWNLLLKNNKFFLLHNQKVLTMRGFFVFLLKSKRNLKMLKTRLGYFPMIGKYFKMHVIVILKSLRYLVSNNSLKILLFLWLQKIRKQLRIFKANLNSNKRDSFKKNRFTLTWNYSLFKYNFLYK